MTLEEERSAAGTASAQCWMSPSSWCRNLPYPPRRSLNSSAVRGERLLKVLARSDKVQECRQYYRRVCNRMPTCPKCPLSPCARHLTAIMRHLDDAAEVSTWDDVPSSVDVKQSAEAVKKNNRMINLFAAIASHAHEPSGTK